MTKQSITDLFTAEILKKVLDNIEKRYKHNDCPTTIKDNHHVERHGIVLIDSRHKDITINLDKNITGLLYLKDYHGSSADNHITILSEKPIDDLYEIVINSPFESITLYGTEEKFSIL